MEMPAANIQMTLKNGRPTKETCPLSGTVTFRMDTL